MCFLACLSSEFYTGDWPDLVQRVLNLHIKQPQQRVKLVFSTGTLVVLIRVLLTLVLTTLSFS